METHKEVYRAGQDKHAGGQQSVGRTSGSRHRIAKPIVTTNPAARRGPYSLVIEFRFGKTKQKKENSRPYVSNV